MPYLLSTVDTVRLTVKLSKCTNYHYVGSRFEPYKYYEQHQKHVFFFLNGSSSLDEVKYPRVHIFALNFFFLKKFKLFGDGLQCVAPTNWRPISKYTPQNLK